MSADQQSVDRPPSSDDPIQHSRSAVELEFQSPGRSPQPADADSSGESTAPLLHYRIERAHLQARITALERELEASEERNQTIIAQYERVLEDRQDGSSRSDSSATAGGPLERLLAKWR